MYKDNSLVPSEAIRLAALGLLARQERSYADLARDIRHFTARIVGPSLDLLGPSLELFKVEGLMEAADAAPGRDAPAHDEQFMRLTAAGQQEFRRLMTTKLRGPMGEVNKLIIALKMHFLDLLAREEQLAQIEMLEETCDRELARLGDLRGHHSDEATFLTSWLDHEIDEVDSRRQWFRRLREGL
jgi:DNA-binding PadR family transcriptional regulator